MKILKDDKKEGMLELKIENPNDVWELENVLEEGDKVSSKTMRRKMIDRKDGQEKGEKRPVYLTIELEKIKFHQHTGNLRLTGPIKDGPEDVELDSYHTIVAEPGKVLAVVKEGGWKKWQIKTIKKAYKRPPKVLVCVLDREKATIANVGSSTDIVATVRSGKPGKQYDSVDSGEYIGEVASMIRRKEGDFDHVVVGGPGFMKDELYIELKEDDISKKCTKANTSHADSAGVEEVIKRGVIDKVVKDSRLSKESKAVEQLFEELSKETGKVAYGKDEVRKAVDLGAVKKILVSEGKIKEFKDTVNEAEKRGSDVLIVSERHESGEKLGKMGGIAAFLRYRIS